VKQPKTKNAVVLLGTSRVFSFGVIMANVVDQDQQWLLSCLSATLDPNQEVRSFAEASLDQASRQSGFVNYLVLEP
jgi:uncharacterized protein YhjY with autotransporter beta-barrel domain